MTSFALPRTSIAAHVLLTQGETRAGEVYVMERVPQHDGPETVAEMLNRPGGFFPFRPADGDAVLLVSKINTVIVSLEGPPIADPARLSAATQIGLELVLAGGTRLAGWASAELPPPQSRLIDYLNASRDAFFALWTQASTHYVNRAHVLYALPHD